jgi:hypothetical protein
VALDEFDAFAHGRVGGDAGEEAELIGAEAEGGEDLRVGWKLRLSIDLEEKEIELGAAAEHTVGEFGGQGGVGRAEMSAAGFEGRVGVLTAAGGH